MRRLDRQVVQFLGVRFQIVEFLKLIGNQRANVFVPPPAEHHVPGNVRVKGLLARGNHVGIRSVPLAGSGQ